MPIFRLADDEYSAMAQVLVTRLDAPASPAYAEVYADTIPENTSTAIGAQTKLGTCTLGADPSATNTGGLITFAPITEEDAAIAGGIASFMRIFKGDGTVWADLDIGDLASNATAKMNTTTVVAGGPIRINSFTILIG